MNQCCNSKKTIANFWVQTILLCNCLFALPSPCRMTLSMRCNKGTLVEYAYINLKSPVSHIPQFRLFCLIVWWMKAFAVAIAVLKSVRDCCWPSSCRIYQIGLALWVLWNNAAISDSATLEVTWQMVLYLVKIGPFSSANLVGEALSLKKKWLVSRLQTHRCKRNGTSKSIFKTTSLAWKQIVTLGYVTM